MLRDEDGKIYDNIQFKPKLLLSMDRPLAQYMEYVNQLEPSRWSTEAEGRRQGAGGGNWEEA